MWNPLSSHSFVSLLYCAMLCDAVLCYAVLYCIGVLLIVCIEYLFWLTVWESRWMDGVCVVSSDILFCEFPGMEPAFHLIWPISHLAGSQCVSPMQRLSAQATLTVTLTLTFTLTGTVGVSRKQSKSRGGMVNQGSTCTSCGILNDGSSRACRLQEDCTSKHVGGPKDELLCCRNTRVGSREAEGRMNSTLSKEKSRTPQASSKWQMANCPWRGPISTSRLSNPIASPGSLSSSLSLSLSLEARKPDVVGSWSIRLGSQQWAFSMGSPSIFASSWGGVMVMTAWDVPCPCQIDGISAYLASAVRLAGPAASKAQVCN